MLIKHEYRAQKKKICFFRFYPEPNHVPKFPMASSLFRGFERMCMYLKRREKKHEIAPNTSPERVMINLFSFFFLFLFKRVL